MKRIPRPKFLAVAAVGVALSGVVAGCASTTSAGTSGTSGTSDASSSGTSASSTSDDSASYKNGTYTTDSTYTSPGGQEEVAVTVTVKSNLISAVTVKTITAEGEGAQYQARFESAISTVALGKSLGSLSVSTVAGSSLTSQAFNSALESIRKAAAA